MTAHRFCYILTVLAAVGGLGVVVLVNNPEPTLVWGFVFATLGLFALGHCIDTP